LVLSQGAAWLRPQDYPKLQFSTPIRAFNQDSIKLTCGSRPIPFSLKKKDDRMIGIHADLMEDSTYKIISNRGFLIDIFGRPLDSLNTTFHVAGKNELGNLFIEVENANEKNQFLYTLEGPSGVEFPQINGLVTTLNFEGLVPGKYKIRVVKDENKNNRWDNGIFIQHQLPERIFYSQEILVRANWDLEEKVTIRFD
jgi:hypothetical protein